MDRLKEWLELAQKFHGKDFWTSVFDQEYAKQFLGDMMNSNRTDDSDFPRVDVLKSENELIVLIDIPGINKEDVQLSINDDNLHIRGNARQPYPGAQRHTSERFSGPFERTVKLPEKAGSGGKISARFNNGLLEVRISRVQRPRHTIKID
ncbi:Hsp20/alpha crystallin family protein [Paenibacillus thermotolerans]|uniref:Hsp20/alpha crystallin family protein n=1 Tax=Paenibacillus thermotolerans TaxID=3027807 RepID=UPI0023675DE1|nr:MULTISPECIES: Hsp20/alpha crystallin family protein [unclassified Paenibacillus]